MLCWLYKVRLYMKAEKYKFYSDLVEYLRYILFPSRLTITSNKIKTIQNWPKLKKIKNVQAFLGFSNFRYYFIYNYYSYFSNSADLKKILWNFNASCYKEFNNLKKTFTFTSILTYWISNIQMTMKSMS